MRIHGHAAMLGAGLWLVAAAAHGEPSPQARAFGTREYVQQISLSPAGDAVAIVTPDATRGASLVVATLGGDGAPRTILRTSGNPERLTGCQWSTRTRLICSVYMIVTNGIGTWGYTRSIAVNSDGSDLKMLTRDPGDRALGVALHGGTVIDWNTSGKPGTALMTKAFVPQISGSLITRDKPGLGVELVDTVSLSRSIVEQPNVDAAEYISDGHGQVRIMGLQNKTPAGYAADSIRYLFRRKGDREWRAMGTLDTSGPGERGFNPYAVDSASDVVYGFDDKDGRRALYRMALDGSARRDLVLANSQVDVDGLVRIGRDRRVVGASFATDVRRTEFFDPTLKALAASLGKALPTKPILSFVDASDDESKLLLYAGSDVDPGGYYLYDKAKRSLGEVSPVRPLLAGQALAPMKPVTYPAADGTMIPGYLTLPVGKAARGLPAIVLPHGGPGARDEWGFDWLAQFFAARGYAVLQPNFRGSTGYGDAWFQKNGFQSWRTAIGDVDDAGRWLVKQGIAAPQHMAVFGWSYGGYAALQSGVLDPGLFKAVVAVAPVTDLGSLAEASRESTSFRSVQAFVGRGAHVREGSPAQNAAAIVAPVLMFHGDRDRNVDIAQSRLMADRLRGAGKPVELVEYKGLDHQLDDSAARTEMLDRADQFLRKTMGLQE